MPSSKPASPEPEETLWQEINPNLDAFRTIISNHFDSPCMSEQQFQPGAYARAFLYVLHNRLHVVGRVILPARRTLKTEAEVAAMDSIRARTSIPVPRIHLYCSTPDNPVRAEWVLMDYVPGQRLVDCWDRMAVPQKTRTAKDLARAMAEMFALTASHCGALRCDLSLTDSQRSQRYEPAVRDTTVVGDTHTEVVDGGFLISPVNDISFLEDGNIVHASLCGPFKNERAFLEAIGWRNAKTQDWADQWPIRRMFQIYDVIQPLYAPLIDPTAPFHFAHGDLNAANLIVDCESGEITGFLDWEMAGFRPAWLCATSRTCFDDDPCRFVVDDGQDGPDWYMNDTETDTVLRAVFLAELGQQNPILLDHNRKGVELRAWFSNLCSRFTTTNTTKWIQKYEQYHWPSERGDFPFKVQLWQKDLLTLISKCD